MATTSPLFGHPTSGASKFSQFHLTGVPYKTVNGHEIMTYVLVPKDLKAGKHPVMARFHGGVLVTGSALYEDWTPQWFIDYNLAKSSIVLLTNYRLLPESSGLDILSDIADFWTWVREDLPSFIAEKYAGVEVDLNQVACAGESAGGWVALESGFHQPAGFIKAIIATYPMVDLANDAYSIPKLKTPSACDALIASIKPGTIVSNAIPPARMDVAGTIAAEGRLAEFLGVDERLYPLKYLEKATFLPYAFLIHGLDDVMVSPRGTIEFAGKVEEKFGPDSFQLFTGPGDHGFDTETPVDTPWIKEGLEKVTAAWLGA